MIPKLEYIEGVRVVDPTKPELSDGVCRAGNLTGNAQELANVLAIYVPAERKGLYVQCILRGGQEPVWCKLDDLRERLALLMDNSDSADIELYDAVYLPGHASEIGIVVHVSDEDSMYGKVCTVRWPCGSETNGPRRSYRKMKNRLGSLRRSLARYEQLAHSVQAQRRELIEDEG